MTRFKVLSIIALACVLQFAAVPAKAQMSDDAVVAYVKEGMANGHSYIFSSSNCAYTGMPLERYEMMNELWKKYGNYDEYENN